MEVQIGIFFLTVRSPHDSKNPEIALLFLLKPKIRRRSIKEVQNAIPTPKEYENGLCKTEEQMLRLSLFGPNRGAVDTPGMNRLFKSTLELGYPQPGESISKSRHLIYKELTSTLALDQSMREAKQRGTDIERCSEGLPMSLRMPDADTRSDKISSSFHSHGVSTPGTWTPTTTAPPSRVPSSSVIEGNKKIDSPPRELLTELALDGVDPPVPILPNKTRTSHGELPKLQNPEDIEVFVARRAESPNRPQVPCDEPPRLEYGPAEREAFKAYYKERPSVFQDYFYILEQLPDPPMPGTDTRWSGWPNSPSTPGHSPIADTLMRTHTVTDPVTIPNRKQVR